ncbi:hypothetical protein [Streptococcus pneumoniae]|uniref:hypothetical protein n=1 Tax=Streptococcus pneumoniae TaxID=1313 RepID=UPI000B58AA61|nr:hypothetical protein [Streptococcus pneumoniae]
MKIKEQTKKLAAGCSKQCFVVADGTDEVSHIYTARRLTYIYGKATLTRFEVDFRRVLTSHKGSWELRNVLFQ